MDKGREEILVTLKKFLQEVRDAREYKRALAVKMALEEYEYESICDVLDISPGFISKWKRNYEELGTEGLKLGYKGTMGYLLPEERQQVITWIRAQEVWTLNDHRLKAGGFAGH